MNKKSILILLAVGIVLVSVLFWRTAQAPVVSNGNQALSESEIEAERELLETPATDPVAEPQPPQEGLPSETTPSRPVAPIVQSGCQISGCSSQLCVDARFGDMATTCEWREEYACYQTAQCERQPDGACGWTPSAELQSCLADSNSLRL